MEPRLLAVLVSSLVSEALLHLLSSLQSNPNPLPSSNSTLLPLLLQLLSSSQTAAVALRPRKRKRRQEPHQETDDNPFSALSVLSPRPNPDYFVLHFGMRAATFQWLFGILDPLLDSRDPIPIPLPPPARLALALSRLACGSPYPDLAARFSVPEPAARFLAKHLCRILCTNFRFWIAASDLRPFPSPLPGCCGALAFARFGSLTAQLVSDPTSRILSIAAGFRGDECSALKHSSLYRDAEAGRLLKPGEFLAGDGGGYPLLRWLMVPFREPVVGSCEEDFNAAHRSACRPVRRAVLSLRNWGVLSRLEEEEDKKLAVACVGTCAILHNVLLMREDFSTLSDGADECLASPTGRREAVGLDEDVADGKALALRSALSLHARATIGIHPPECQTWRPVVSSSCCSTSI